MDGGSEMEGGIEMSGGKRWKEKQINRRARARED
jgi:hypothetical protein